MLVISTHIPKSPQKVRNWLDPPPLRQMTTEKLLFFRDGFPYFENIAIFLLAQTQLR